jgi:hypothetical protein
MAGDWWRPQFHSKPTRVPAFSAAGRRHKPTFWLLAIEAKNWAMSLGTRCELVFNQDEDSPVTLGDRVAA